MAFPLATSARNSTSTLVSPPPRPAERDHRFRRPHQLRKPGDLRLLLLRKSAQLPLDRTSTLPLQPGLLTCAPVHAQLVFSISHERGPLLHLLRGSSCSLSDISSEVLELVSSLSVECGELDGYGLPTQMLRNVTE
ncbi:hypothetical protein BZA05DRAFT_422599 [Tricharina praecox]|uniref:uncharacterized protein n=1 Tax=Tricharina praecox TaxID=43433 RepID=UPI0022203E0E|nr:uncharacterized protein BZA05DRAFT_422599 [Tricharina praecox]KAI5842256.1 hypothetical protein BZA05DRAFT_422599 [Tricharina praecox]